MAGDWDSAKIAQTSGLGFVEQGQATRTADSKAKQGFFQGKLCVYINAKEETQDRTSNVETQVGVMNGAVRCTRQDKERRNIERLRDKVDFAASSEEMMGRLASRVTVLDKKKRKERQEQDRGGRLRKGGRMASPDEKNFQEAWGEAVKEGSSEHQGLGGGFPPNQAAFDPKRPWLAAKGNLHLNDLKYQVADAAQQQALGGSQAKSLARQAIKAMVMEKKRVLDLIQQMNITAEDAAYLNDAVFRANIANTNEACLFGMLLLRPHAEQFVNTIMQFTTRPDYSHKLLLQTLYDGWTAAAKLMATRLPEEGAARPRLAHDLFSGSLNVECRTRLAGLADYGGKFELYRVLISPAMGEFRATLAQAASRTGATPARRQAYLEVMAMIDALTKALGNDLDRDNQQIRRDTQVA